MYRISLGRPPAKLLIECRTPLRPTGCLPPLAPLPQPGRTLLPSPFHLLAPVLVPLQSVYVRGHHADPSPFAEDHCALFPRVLGKWNSRRSISRILHSPAPIWAEDGLPSSS